MRSKDGKTRTDAWEAPLAEEARWDLFDRARTHSCGAVMDHAAEVYGLPRCSRAAFYNFIHRMRGQDFSRKLRQAAIAREECGRLARERATDSDLAEAYMTMAQDLATSGDADGAVKFTKMALDIQKQALDRQALELSKAKFEAQERRLAKVNEVVAEAKAKGITAETLARIEEAAKLL